MKMIITAAVRSTTAASQQQTAAAAQHTVAVCELDQKVVGFSALQKLEACKLRDSWMNTRTARDRSAARPCYVYITPGS